MQSQWSSAASGAWNDSTERSRASSARQSSAISITSTPPFAPGQPFLQSYGSSIGVLVNRPIVYFSSPWVAPVGPPHTIAQPWRSVACYNPPYPSTTPATEPRCHCAGCHLAMSNERPSVHEAGVTSNLLWGWKMEADAIRHQLRALQDRLRDVEASYTLYGPILAPIRRLPLEIFGEIFSHLGSQDALSKICRVCKTWRDAAYLTSKLWQHTTVNLQGSSTSLTYEAVTAWMSRAKALPRTLRLESSQCSDSCKCHCAAEIGGACQFVRPIIGEILKSGISLDHASLGCPSPGCLKILAAYIQAFQEHAQPSTWDSIQKFTISVNWVREEVTVPSKTFSFLPASIKSLQLDLLRHTETPWFRPKTDILPDVLQRLTDLSLTCDWSGSYILCKVLPHCNNLEKLALELRNDYFMDLDEDDESSVTTIADALTLPNLRTIAIEGEPLETIEDLTLLRLPSLRDVSVMFGSHEDPLAEDSPISEDDASLLRDFVRGNCSDPSAVRTLRIRNAVFEGQTLFEALHDLPALKHLTLEHVMFDSEDLFELLSSDALLPQLENLKLLQLHHLVEDTLSMRAFMQQRPRINSTISPCKVNCF